MAISRTSSLASTGHEGGEMYQRPTIMDEHGFEPDRPSPEHFVQMLTKAQLGLMRYITALVGDPHAANNILQETNLLLWRKADEFEKGTNFDAWATKVAYWQVKAYLRDSNRDRHVFSDELIAQLAECPESETDFDRTIQTLRSCLEMLRSVDRELVALRYGRGFSVSQLSTELGKTPAAVKGALLRTRRALRTCIERRLKRER